MATWKIPQNGKTKELWRKEKLLLKFMESRGCHPNGGGPKIQTNFNQNKDCRVRIPKMVQKGRN